MWLGAREKWEAALRSWRLKSGLLLAYAANILLSREGRAKVSLPSWRFNWCTAQRSAVRWSLCKLLPCGVAALPLTVRAVRCG